MAISKSLLLHKHPKPHRTGLNGHRCFFQRCYKDYNVKIFVSEQVNPMSLIYNLIDACCCGTLQHDLYRLQITQRLICWSFRVINFRKKPKVMERREKTKKGALIFGYGCAHQISIGVIKNYRFTASIISCKVAMMYYVFSLLYICAAVQIL